MGQKWNFTYSLYFLLGDSSEPGISEEINLFGDLIIGNFTDTYDNLPLKTFMAFQFFGNNCFWKKKKVLILQDTDCFLTLRYILTDYGMLQTTDRFGNVMRGYPVLMGEKTEALYCLRGLALPNTDMINTGLYVGKWWIKESQWPPRYMERHS